LESQTVHDLRGVSSNGIAIRTVQSGRHFDIDAYDALTDVSDISGRHLNFLAGQEENACSYSGSLWANRCDARRPQTAGSAKPFAQAPGARWERIAREQIKEHGRQDNQKIREQNDVNAEPRVYEEDWIRKKD